jgi:hypothetical protein
VLPIESGGKLITAVGADSIEVCTAMDDARHAMRSVLS